MFPLSQNQYKFIRSLQSKKGRDKENWFLVEGIRLCEEVLNSDYQINYFILSDNLQKSKRNKYILNKIQSQKIPVFVTDEKNFAVLADTQTPQGIACVVTKKNDPKDWSLGSFLLGLDAIRDPGNMGTIIRTAEWFGIDGILSGVNSVEIYNPKVIRSTMGALFHVPFHENVQLYNELSKLKQLHFEIIGAVSKDGVPLEQFKKKEKTVLLIGNEAQGLSPELDSITDTKICIAGKGNSESLNAAIATGILLYFLTKNN